MKTIKLTLAFAMLLGFLSIPMANAQQQPNCATEQFQPSESERMMEIYHVSTCGRYYPTEYCFNVRPHIVRKDDGSGAISDTDVQAELDRMQAAFNPHGINFIVDDFQYIDETDYWLDPSLLFGSSFSSDSYIDMYFVGNDDLPSAANGIGRNSELFVSSYFLGGGNTAHEMGHVMGLFHTFHSTKGCVLPASCENSDPFGIANHVRERVVRDGSQECTSGDYVSDTPADNGAYEIWTAPANCVWNDDGIDENGDTYEGDLENIMSYGTTECIKYLTVGQATRIKYYLETEPLPHLIGALADCPTDPPLCESCDTAALNTSRIFNTLTPTAGNPCEYTLSWPSAPWIVCADKYQIQWNGEPIVTLENSGESTTTVFESAGTYPVVITEISDTGEICPSQTFYVTVSEDCNPAPDCSKTCSEIADRIMASLTLSLTNPCWSYGVKIPAMEGCYYGTIKWGDGTNEPMVYGDSMTHMYSAPGPYRIRILLYDTQTERLCDKLYRDIQINCSTPLRMFPNPTSGTFEVQTDKTITQLTVRSIYGKTVHVLTDNFKRPISISNELSGIYFVEVNFDDGTSVIKKLVLE